MSLDDDEDDVFIVDESKGETKDGAIVRGHAKAYDVRTRSKKLTEQLAGDVTLVCKDGEGKVLAECKMPKSFAAISDIVRTALTIEGSPISEYVVSTSTLDSKGNTAKAVQAFHDSCKWMMLTEGKQYGTLDEKTRQVVETKIPKPLISTNIKDLTPIVGETRIKFFEDNLMGHHQRGRLYAFYAAMNYFGINNGLHLSAASVASLMKGKPLAQVPDILKEKPLDAAPAAGAADERKA